MKRRITIGCVLSILLSMQLLQAQPMAALQQSGETTFFSGNESFREAYAAASDGAIIYLSGGTFLVPDSIAKTLTVFGTGHHPEFSGATGQTAISGDMNMANGSDNSHFEGIHFQNALEFGKDLQIDNLVFRRCRIDGRINSTYTTGNQSRIHNMLITECVLAYTSGNNLYNLSDLTITNSIIAGTLSYGSFILVTNTILLSTTNQQFYYLQNSTVQNCIIVSNLTQMNVTQENRFLNNVVFNIESGFNWRTASNVHSNNYYSVSRDNFFVDQEGNTFDYTHNYQLQSPGQYIGTDGTQVGIYGGMHPFKEGSVPMIPHVVSKSISHSIDAEGKLQVEIEVSAQDH